MDESHRVVLQSIRRAHANIKPGKLRINSGELLDANANRSPTAYLQNPEEERARYKHNTDKIMTQLSVMNPEGKGDNQDRLLSAHLLAAKHVSESNTAQSTASMYRYMAATLCQNTMTTYMVLLFMRCRAAWLVCSVVSTVRCCIAVRLMEQISQLHCMHVRHSPTWSRNHVE